MHRVVEYRRSLGVAFVALAVVWLVVGLAHVAMGRHLQALVEFSLAAAIGVSGVDHWVFQGRKRWVRGLNWTLVVVAGSVGAVFLAEQVRGLLGFLREVGVL